MYTSDKRNSESLLKTALIYLGISIFLAFAGGVYEYFSHGVWSYWMVYAFAIPLAGGTLPFLIAGLREGRKASASHDSTYMVHSSVDNVDHAGHAIYGAGSQDIEKDYIKNESPDGSQKMRFSAANMYQAALATFTAGSLMNGVLEIYGTGNPLIYVYPAAGAMLLIAGIATWIAAGRTQKSTVRKISDCVKP